MMRRLVLPSVLLLLAAAVAQSLLSVGAASPPDVPKSSSDAALDTDELRARLQSHVESHVNRLLSEKAAGGGGAGGSSGKGGSLELKIDLPPDLASQVAGLGGAAVTIHRDQATATIRHKAGSVVLGGDNNNAGKPQVIYQEGGKVSVGASPPESKDGAAAGDNARDAGTTTTTPQAVATTPCPLGYYSDLGYAPTEYFKECDKCRDGYTTMKVGDLACVKNPTEAELLGMLYDVVGGDAWKEEQKRGWKTDAPVCEWEGITCDESGEVVGFAFPTMGLKMGDKAYATMSPAWP